VRSLTALWMGIRVGIVLVGSVVGLEVGEVVVVVVERLRRMADRNCDSEG